MVQFLKVKKQNAQKIKKELKNSGFYNEDYKAISEEEFILFPIMKNLQNIPGKIVEQRGVKINRKTTLKEALKEQLNKEELELLPSSYDVVGDIIILELKEELNKKAKLIGEEILSLHKNVKTILNRTSARTGEFRLHKLKLLAGKDNRETIHKESGAKIKLDVEKVYFSIRSSTERLRIASLVKKKENVLVMFSGCGPFPLVISKNSEANYILGIEKNPIAHEYAEENLKLNKVKNVEFMCGDVRNVIKKLDKKFDRICMPLPIGAGDFLDIALLASKKGTVIHLYDFLDEKGISMSKENIEKLCKKNGVKCSYKKTVKCGQFSPDLFRVCHDFVVKEI